jgi:hypothetical protein
VTGKEYHSGACVAERTALARPQTQISVKTVKQMKNVIRAEDNNFALRHIETVSMIASFLFGIYSTYFA